MLIPPSTTESGAGDNLFPLQTGQADSTE